MLFRLFLVQANLLYQKTSMRLRGKITTWKDDRGFGFITPIRGGEHVFVHISAFSNRHRRPICNEFVTYEAVSDNQGRIRAEHVEFRDDSPTTPDWAIPLTLALLFLMFVGASVLVGQLSIVVLAIYLIASAISFRVYAHDKSAAKQNRPRIPENTFHVLSVLGGWPGALVAQQLFRHKSKKQSFRNAFWGTVGLNCFVLVWLLFL